MLLQLFGSKKTALLAIGEWALIVVATHTFCKMGFSRLVLEVLRAHVAGVGGRTEHLQHIDLYPLGSLKGRVAFLAIRAFFELDALFAVHGIAVRALFRTLHHVAAYSTVEAVMDDIRVHCLGMSYGRRCVGLDNLWLWIWHLFEVRVSLGLHNEFLLTDF